jgi:hypothetical protein
LAKDAKYNPIRTDRLLKITVVYTQNDIKKSVVGLFELVMDGSFGFFITVTRPPNSSNRNGVELLLAQIN